MIGRTWHGQAPSDAADDYVGHLQAEVIPTLERLDGFLGVLVLRRENGDRIDFGVLTLWESMEAIEQFAGSSPQRAVVAPEARALLSGFEEHVKHHEIAVCDLRLP